ncbi:MAG: glycosyltransferase, partial [Bacteroidales bacterium]|nr:glycosyltransferase [Bacteroidales bacterium]MDD4575647.1 glycosyltransferase [Bacteroidales bacterium]
FETMLIGGEKDKSEANSDFIINNLGLEVNILHEMKREINFTKDVVAYQKLKKIIHDFKPDIVHTHASKAGALGRWAAHICGVPVVIHTFHGHVFDAYFGNAQANFYKLIERKLAKISTKIIAISENQKQDLVYKYNICPDEKVEIIKLGFDLERFQHNNDEKRLDFRSKYLIKDDEIAIALTGRIVPVKNHTLFLNAIAQLSKLSTRKLRFFIVGDGEDRKKVEEKAKLLKIDYVDFNREPRPALLTFTSWIKDVDVVNAGVDIVALTSLNEGTPVSLIEAQASGKPIVSTNVGGISNVVIENKTALLSESNNVHQFTQNLLSLVENDDFRKQLSNQGIDFVMEKFHYSRLVSEMADLYHTLLAQKQSVRVSVG